MVTRYASARLGLLPPTKGPFSFEIKLSSSLKESAIIRISRSLVCAADSPSTFAMLPMPISAPIMFLAESSSDFANIAAYVAMPTVVPSAPMCSFLYCPWSCAMLANLGIFSV